MKNFHFGFEHLKTFLTPTQKDEGHVESTLLAQLVSTEGVFGCEGGLYFKGVFKGEGSFM